MSLSVDVVKIGQELHMDSGATDNFVLLQLPNGGVVRAAINEEAAQALVACHVSGVQSKHIINQENAYAYAPSQSLNTSKPIPNGFVQTTTLDGTSALEFGGDTQPPPAANIPVNRMKFVGKDEYGYPIMRSTGSNDPGEISTSGNLDEDGIGQV